MNDADAIDGDTFIPHRAHCNVVGFDRGDRVVDRIRTERESSQWDSAVAIRFAVYVNRDDSGRGSRGNSGLRDEELVQRSWRRLRWFVAGAAAVSRRAGNGDERACTDSSLFDQRVGTESARPRCRNTPNPVSVRPTSTSAVPV